MATTQGIRARLLSSADDRSLIDIPDGALSWSTAGEIVYAGAWSTRPTSQPTLWDDLRPLIVTPGFIDVHCHLPQYSAVARGGLELLPWLQRHIFPIERNFSAGVAATQAPAFFRELTRYGITSAAVYTTIDAESTEICFEAAQASGLRILMGQMMMDVNSYASGSPRDLTTQMLDQSSRLCERWHGADAGRLTYAFSPRFALSCSEALMIETGKLARSADAFIQTHLAENRSELAAVRRLFPDSADYTGVYEKCGLLGLKTVVGHAIYLSEREYKTLAQTGTKIAHCPSSNAFLTSGVLDYERIRHHGLIVGLASDVAGGPELNPWDVMKAGSYSHQLRATMIPGSRVPDLAELFFLATAGSAAVIGESGRIGQLRSGLQADLAAWDLAEITPHDEPTDHATDALSLLIYRHGGCRYAARTWVKGRLISP